MSFLNLRRWCAALAAVVMMAGQAPDLWAASPDFYGIKMNSENHARDLSPDELSLFPVRRGFDKNIYAYAHLSTTFNHTRSITFNIFNNTDNDLMTEKSFREYYVVLRNGERYRLNEPGMAINKDRIHARSSAALSADFGSLNVTKEQIEMVVCSFDMGKVKIVLLPIAQELPAPRSAEEARSLTGQGDEREPAGVYARDQVDARIRGENEIRRAPETGKGRFPVMDLPIFSWLKNASARPEAEARPISTPAAAVATIPSDPTPPKTNISTKASMPLAVTPITQETPVLSEKKPAPRRGFFGGLFSFLAPDEPRSNTAPKKMPARAASPETKRASLNSVSPIDVDKEFFWKPRYLDPIQPIGAYEKKKSGEGVAEPVSSKKLEPSQKTLARLSSKETPSAKPFFMRRVLEDSGGIPHDEPVSAVSAPQSKEKAPVLNPTRKLKRVGPRVDAKVAQVNRQMGFIVVNAGSGDGIRENAVLNIYQRGKVIAKAIVRKVNEDASAAILMKEWARADVSVGDPVSFY